MINQDVVDAVMFVKSGHSGDYSCRETLLQIRDVLKTRFNVDVSNVEAHVFWKWRSELYDASFLTFENPDDVIKWFMAYCRNTLDNDFEVMPYGDES